MTYVYRVKVKGLHYTLIHLMNSLYMMLLFIEELERVWLDKYGNQINDYH
jgi:hypothetical protein